MTQASSNWERYYSTLKRMPKRLKKTAQFIVGILPDLKNHKVEKVLDVGCGSGRHCVLLASSGFDVVGMDISKSALRMANRWVQKERLENVALVRATMTNVPVNDCCLDAVVGVSVMWLLEIKEEELKAGEFVRSLFEGLETISSSTTG